MIKQYVDILFMDGELMLGETLRLYKGDKGILVSVKVEKQYYRNNKLITENLIELGKYGRAIIRKGQHDCPTHNEESEEPVYCSEVAKIKDGRLDILIPKEAIDETSEMGTYQIQIQLYGGLNEGERPRLTLDPFEFEACDLISEDLELEDPTFIDETAIVDSSEVDDSMLPHDGEELPYEDEDGNYNLTIWEKGHIIWANKLNKIENAIGNVYEKIKNFVTRNEMEEYVTKAIDDIPEVDLSSFATEEYVNEAIEALDILEVITIGSGNDYEIFELNLKNVKPDKENYFVFKKVKIDCKDNDLYFDDAFVCITVIDDIVYEIKELRSGIVHSISKTEDNVVLEYSSRPMTDIEYADIRDIIRIDDASAIEYFKNYFNRNGLYYFDNVSIKCIVGGKSKIVSFNDRLVEITIYSSYLNLFDYKDCLIYKFNHNGSKITGFVGQGELTDAHETRLNDRVNSAINNSVAPVYATKKELNDAVANIETPDIDLDGIATEEYVNNAIANIKIPEADLTDYATKEYVDEEVNSIQESLNNYGNNGRYIVNKSFQLNSSTTDTPLDSRVVVETEADITRIINPYIGMIFYVKELDKLYVVQTLTSRKSGIITIENGAVGTYREIHPETDLSDYATKDYVNNAVNARPSIDLSGYATKEELNDAINNIEIPEVDLSNYATKDELKRHVDQYDWLYILEGSQKAHKLETQLGDIDSILDSINGEVI